MGKKFSITKTSSNYWKEEFSEPGLFSLRKKTGNETKGGPFFNFQYQANRLNSEEVKSVIIKAKKDYGKVFEKLAAED